MTTESAAGKPSTIGEWRRMAGPGGAADRGVKDEMRCNLLRKLEGRETLFEGIRGYEETVLPQIANAILARHNFILLGLRGQAKSRILRGLVNFLEPEIPYISGCEIHDHPLRPICRACRELVAEQGDRTPIAWLKREDRFVEKLATPDVTIADIIGDVDPIKAARGGRDLSDELTVHYGLLPRRTGAFLRSTNCRTWRERFKSASSTSCRKGMYRLRATRSGCRWMSCWSLRPTPRITRRAEKLSHHSKTAWGAKSARIIP